MEYTRFESIMTYFNSLLYFYLYRIAWNEK